MGVLLYCELLRSRALRLVCDPAEIATIADARQLIRPFPITGLAWRGRRLFCSYEAEPFRAGAWWREAL